MKLKLSIVIVNLNTKDLTIGCLRSIQKESKNLKYEVLLADNGSNDGSLEALKSLKKEQYWQNKITLIFNNNNTGYAKANNQGIKKAVGEYILLLNNDTVVHKHALQNLIDFADRHPDAGVVGSRLLNVDGSRQSSCYHFPTITNAIKEYLLGQKGLFEKFAPNGNEAVIVDSVVGAAFLITPKARKLVGMLDERYFAYFEDIDYCRQVFKNGLKVYYLPNSVITHYHGATFKKLADDGARWKKLIPSSIIYHGFFKHYLLYVILWIGQKWQKIRNFK